MFAFLLKPLIPWAVAGVAVVVLGGWVYLEREGRIAAEKGEQVALERADLKAQDAARWQAASDVRDAAIGQLKTALDAQSAAVEASRAKEAQLRKSLDSARLQNDRLSAEAESMRAEIDAEAEAAPGDVRELGPIVTRRAKALFE